VQSAEAEIRTDFGRAMVDFVRGSRRGVLTIRSKRRETDDAE